MDKANQLLRTDNAETRRHIVALFLGLTSADFCHRAPPMRPKHGGVLLGDVYGKQDDFGLWFVKFTFDARATTVILSCHEAEHDLELANGSVLRKPRS